METMPRGGHNAIPEADLINALRQLADDLGRSPSQADINEHSPHSAKTYYRKFDGGMQEAKRRAGLETYEQQGKDKVVVFCGNCGAPTPKQPSEIENAEYNYCSQDCYHADRGRRFSGEDNHQWNRKTVNCDYCGGETTKTPHQIENRANLFCSPDCYAEWRSEEIVGEKHGKWVEYPKIECEWCGKVKAVKPSVADERRFCGKRCASRWKSEAYTGEDNPHWKGGRVPYYGANWLRRRREAIIRDQARCQDCGLNESKSVKQFGEGLSVHHITPIRSFRYEASQKVDYHNANALDNLISLCRPCHIRREKSN